MPITSRLVSLALLASLAACAPAPPAVPSPHDTSPRAVQAAPLAKLSAEPVAATPSAGCTDIPLPLAAPNAKPIRPTKEQTQLLADVDRLLAARPAQDDSPATRALTQARALWRAEQWPEATWTLGDVALKHPREDAGIVAAMLYLEGLNLLGSAIEPARPSCYDEMANRLPALQRLYCERGEARRHPRECYLLYKIEVDIHRGGGCGIPASKPKVLPSIEYARAGETYLARAVRCVEVTRAAGVSPLDERCDDLAFYAVRAFMSVPDEVRAREARALLLAPENGMLKSRHIEEMTKLTPR